MLHAFSVLCAHEGKLQIQTVQRDWQPPSRIFGLTGPE
ncbi:hypothetical protein CEV33_0067 [Brucella grignonensis]|uniref:Uncharacterized protein n=1 Tax=Brucella grignonensis TaxID=94627 RepID=A0A256FMM3_9HYPH|nr:hypothetical protein CEV33_0067 [Brucella grignonensis]